MGVSVNSEEVMCAKDKKHITYYKKILYVRYRHETKVSSISIQGTSFFTPNRAATYKKHKIERMSKFIIKA